MPNPYAAAKKNINKPVVNTVEVVPGRKHVEPPASSTPTPTKQAPVTLTIPVGTISEVTTWVAGDKERAQAALAAEKKGANRKTLLTTLEGIVRDS